ncbi:MAG: hypothetical protein J5I93_25110 [Pirellulaceae bacterium]|nr:hypothetical protein [Pirellulaceae bacterium]
MDEDTRETAFHEAGHKVAAARLGFDIGDCDIIPDDEDGRAGVSRDEGPWMDGSRDEDHVIVLYSGFQAQRRHNPQADPAVAGRDDEEAAHYVQLNKFSEVELRKRAEELLDKHWAEVEAIATLLIEEKRLDGYDIEVVLEAFDEGEDWRGYLANFRRLRKERGI